MVTLGHRADLRHGLMAFVDKQQRIFGQIFKQSGGRLPGQAARQKARIIFDARATAGRRNHFQVEVRPLLKPLRFQQFAFGHQLLQPLCKFEPNGFAGLLHRWAGRHIVAVRVHAHTVQLGACRPCQRVKLCDFLNLVAKETDAPCHVFIMRWENFQIVAPHAKIAAGKAGVVALILQRDELADQFALINALACFQVEYHR